MPVLDRNTPTPPDTLVFVPHDGRELLGPRGRALAHFEDLAYHHGMRRALRNNGLIPRAAGWVLVPCLVSLRSEFNALAPTRDKASDGSIGDTAHSASSSDHNPDETGATPYEDSDAINEVHAIDVDVTLNRSGWSMRRCVDIIVGEHRAGRDDRLQNVIYNRQIASRSWGWTWRDYTGASPHTEHAHFSARYTTAQESDTSPWALLAAVAQEDDMSAADVTAINNNTAKLVAAMEDRVNIKLAELDKQINQVAPEVMNQPAGASEVVEGRLNKQVLGDQQAVRTVQMLGPNHPERLLVKPQAGSALDVLLGLPARLDAIGQATESVRQDIAALRTLVNGG